MVTCAEAWTLMKKFGEVLRQLKRITTRGRRRFGRQMQSEEMFESDEQTEVKSSIVD